MTIDPVIDVALRASLGVLFAAAASHKLREPRRFRATVAEYRLLPATLVTPAALALVGVEITVAAALVTPGWRAAGLLGAAALLALYAGAIAINLARGRRDLDCGCAGPAVRRPISGWLVARNGVLAALALAGLAPAATRPLVWVDALTILGSTATLAALYVSVDRMLANLPGLARVRGVA
jgi:Methylamine utilisation protein MauE